jgi:hypothetical protein
MVSWEGLGVYSSDRFRLRVPKGSDVGVVRGRLRFAVDCGDRNV